MVESDGSHQLDLTVQTAPMPVYVDPWYYDPWYFDWSYAFDSWDFFFPIVLDLNGDGVRLTDYASAPVLFDSDGIGDGLERTGWVSPTDGLVVKDVNGDGIINDSSELAGQFYKAVPGRSFADGFQVLRYYDANADGILTAAEAHAAGWRIWIDANHDARTDAGELKTFAELGVQQIDLAAQAQAGVVRDGNEVLFASSFTQNVNAAGEGVPLGTTGSQIKTREVLDASFLANPFGSLGTTLANGGTLVTTQGGSAVGHTRAYVSNSTNGEVINLASAANGSPVDNAFGGSGNDTLNGNALNNWIAGGAGSDTFNGGGGNDVLLIDGKSLDWNYAQTRSIGELLRCTSGPP